MFSTNDCLLDLEARETSAQQSQEEDRKVKRNLEEEVVNQFYFMHYKGVYLLTELLPENFFHK